jgi:hypothetical protein
MDCDCSLLPARQLLHTTVVQQLQVVLLVLITVEIESAAVLQSPWKCSAQLPGSGMKINVQQMRSCPNHQN